MNVLKALALLFLASSPLELDEAAPEPAAAVCEGGGCCVVFYNESVNARLINCWSAQNGECATGSYMSCEQGECFSPGANGGCGGAYNGGGPPCCEGAAVSSTQCERG